MGHSILKHMKSFQSRELTDMPLTSDMTGEGAGRNLGSPAKQRPNYYPKEENVVYTKGGQAARRKNLEAKQKEEDAAKK